jgi:pimeloyl-ACP methyl ester carboxylesterase
MNRTLNLLLIAALILIVGGSLLAWAVQTGGGTIAIHDVRFVGSNGIPMSALLYVPPNASVQTPAPGVVAIHGYINSRETQSGYAIEFARRGYVVLALDQTGHGYSGPPAFANGFGGPDGLRFLRTLDIVDPENIGLEGHSMGGWASLIAAGVFPDDYASIMIQGSSTGTFGAPEGTPEWPRNLGIVFSKYDEFSALMWGSPVPANIVRTEKLQTLFGTDETVEVGRLYGDIEQGTARMLYMPPINHPADHLSTVAIGHAIDWFQQTLEGGSNLPPSDQVWIWKEFGTLLGLIGFGMLLFPVGAMLLQLPYFRPLREPVPAGRPATGWPWWLAAILTVAIPIITFFPFNHLVDAPWTPNPLFPQNLTTGIMFWAVLNGLIFLALFLLWHFLSNRRAGATAANYGLTWDEPGGRGLVWWRIGRSFLLALAIAAIGYLVLLLMATIFRVDFRFWVVALKPMSMLHFRIFLGYLIPFTFFFLVLGTALNGQMRLLEPGGQPVPMWKALLVNVALLVVGFIILLLVQYVPLFAGGTLANPSEPLLTIVAYQFIPLLALVALVSTFFFRLTGRVYVGAFLNALVVTWYIVAGQATHYPF